MQKPIITGLGEVLWDIFPEYRRAGGAPANVAFHANQLGNEGIPASRVGDDDEGRELVAHMSKSNLNTSYIQYDDRVPTGSVEVVITDGEAGYTIPENVAWDRMALTPEWQDLARETDAVCFGTLAQRNEVSRKTIRDFLSHTSECIKIADINLREPHYTEEIVSATLELADVVKMNQNEWKLLEQMFAINDLKNWLFTQKNVGIICLTKGIEGAELMTPELHLVEPVHPVDSTNGDSVGVGDAFTAALTHHLLRNTPLDVTIDVANRYAAQVAARQGAMPSLPTGVIDAVAGKNATS